MPEQSTSTDLVEIVRGFAVSGVKDLDAMLGFFARNAVWEAVPIGTSFRGVEEIRGFLTEWLGAYDSYEIEPQEVRGLGGGVVLAVVRQVVRPVGATAESSIQEAWAFVFEWAGGVVARVTATQDIDKARADAQRLGNERGSRTA